MPGPLGTIEALLDTYITYLNTPFALRYRALVEEREHLLRTPGRIYQDPYTEFLPGYQPSGYTPAQATDEFELGEDVGEFLEIGLFESGDVDLYTHQARALEVATGPQNQHNRHIVVTSGTGSGKTECFLMPIISRLVRESERWSSPESPSPNWWTDNGGYRPRRTHEHRPAAVRALLLYPLNALVEDQMVRLRRALDSEPIKQWLNSHRQQNRFYFGGYNGRTPLPGHRSPGRELELRNCLQKMEREREALMREDQELLPDPTSAEMVVRWDMQAHPPDILVTNFSMMNIMLMRGIESNIFEATRSWLMSDSSNTFTLVVDELHSYRGTPGTEVAHIIRLLLDRIGLSPDSPQLRIIATSASLDEGPEGRRFLSEFFGCSEESFEILPGEPLQPPGREPASWLQYTNGFAEFEEASCQDGEEAALQGLAEVLGCSGQHVRAEVGRKLAECGIPKLLVRSTGASSGRPPVASITEMADRIFLEDARDRYSNRVRKRAVAGMALAVAISEHTERGGFLLPLKIHIFFRNLPGLWACCDPECSHVVVQRNGPVGRLYMEPRLSCLCGSRVLDLHYCQTCGDVFLGGYRSRTGPGGGFYLSAEFPDVDRLPDLPGRGQVLDEYTIFWPFTERPQHMHWTVRGWRVEWRRGWLDPRTGLVHHAIQEGLVEGWYIRIAAEGPDPIEIRALPKYCPNCDDCWAGQFGPGKYISPIRGTRTAFTKIAQLLGDKLLVETHGRPRERKLVMFSDTRRDAAQLARDMEHHHYLDLIRSLLLHHTQTTSIGEGYLAYRKMASEEELSLSEQALATEFENNYPIAARAILKIAGGLRVTIAEQEAIDRIVQTIGLGIPLPRVWDRLEHHLVSLGINPAGIARWATREVEWTRAYIWRDDGSIEYNPEVSGELRNHRHMVFNAMVNEVLHQIFSGRRRSIEDLGFGYVTFAGNPQSLADLNLEISRQIADATIRILGQSRRFEYRPVPEEADQRLYRRSQSENPPMNLKRYLRRVSERHGCEYDDLVQELRDWLEASQGVVRYLLRDQNLLFKRLENPQSGWICPICGQTHLHRSAGVCTSCYGDLSPEPEPLPPAGDNYYANLALSPGTLSRLHCEELTGQTDSIDGFKRLRLFKGRCREDEQCQVEEIDVLNVTTTMEAGIDIGNLRMVMMANMPPERFNYQQRSGRCGRRGQGVSYVLTLCKGRSHDDYYFTNLQAMTAEPPPSPYLDLRRLPIVRRVIASEILRRAFDETELGSEPSERDSVHGEFGKRVDWNEEVDEDGRQKREIIWNWIRDNQDSCRHVVDVLTFGAPALTERTDELLDDLINGPLISLIDQSVAASSEEYLSQALAWEGVLPMFGFPTGIRPLYLQRPRVHRGDWVERTIDRDIKIAIGEFAPGSELIKDKEIHHSVGIAHYHKIHLRGRKISVLSENLLGNEEAVSYCSNCMILNTEVPETCPGCGATLGSRDHREMTLSYPKGFRTDYQPGEGRPGEEERTFASSARSVLGALTPDEANNAVQTRYWMKEGRFYHINDNNGHLFQLQETARDGWIEVDHLERVRIQEEALLGNPVNRAFAARKNSECIVLEPDRPTPDPDLSFRIQDVGVRASLYSFGFLLQRASAQFLDVDSRELHIGIHASRAGGGPVVGRVYLADTLANGAGYARFLSNPANLEHILLDMAQEEESNYLRGMQDHFEEPEICDTSCYNCLRSYQNLRYHGLLNWMLASDTARLFAHGELPSTPSERWQRAVESASDALGGLFEGVNAAGMPALRHLETGHIGIFSHPFLRRYPEGMRSPIVAEAQIEGEEFSSVNSSRVVHMSYFDIIHRPWWVADMIASGQSGDPYDDNV